MKTQSAQAAAEIRKILKQKFPEIHFTVQSENYAGGDSVRVHYQDGPPTEVIEKEIKQYEYGHFDGMIDCYEYSNVRKDIPQTKYLFVNRSMTEDTKQKLINYVQNRYEGCEGKEYEDYLPRFNDRFSTLVYREFVKLDCRFVNFEIELTV